MFLDMKLASLFSILLLFLVSCRPTAAPCPAWPVAYAACNVFDLRHHPIPLDTSARSVLTQAQRRVLLHDAYGINCCLTASAVRDSTYASASFYSTVACLDHNPHAPCQVLVYADMEDFAGLYLVLCAPGPRYTSLFVAGEEGTGGTEDEMHIEPRVTCGRMLNDSVVQVKTGDRHLAFPASGQHSYTDTTTEVFRIDYHKVTFHQVSSQSKRTRLTEYF
jgi:hypothetical protein